MPSASALTQVGQATGASPSSRYMLYLETPALPGRTAAQQLSPAVGALTQQAVSDMGAQSCMQSTGGAPQGSVRANAKPSNADGALPAAAQGSRSATHAQDDRVDHRPLLLMAAYYTQRSGMPSEVRSSAIHTPAVLWPLANSLARQNDTACCWR